MWLGIGLLVGLAAILIAGRAGLPRLQVGGLLTQLSPTGPGEVLQPPVTANDVTSSAMIAGTSRPTLVVTLVGPATPADAWANALLDRVQTGLQQPSQPGDGFAWWQGNEAIGPLTYSDQAVSFRGSRLSIAGETAIGLAIVSPNDPNQLQDVAAIHYDSGALTLNVTSTTPDHVDMQWILAGGSPDTALQALVIQAAARSVVLTAAYGSFAGQAGELVLLSGYPIETPTQALVTATPGETQLASPTAPPPTPTHPPEADLGVAVELKLKPVLDAGLAFPADVVQRFTAVHAWHGSLAWDETGPKVDNRPVNVNQATELTFQILTPNDPRGSAQPFLTTEYTGNVTRFPEDQRYFAGQRMNEILYWMVFYSARQGGILEVSYDDFGARQFMTIIGFRPFNQPQP
jgi:hypothetical protein